MGGEGGGEADGDGEAGLGRGRGPQEGRMRLNSTSSVAKKKPPEMLGKAHQSEQNVPNFLKYLTIKY